MSERELSLIDVMNGMYRLSLQTKLSPPCFRFFWGLIMLGNTLTPRFKNPFDVAVEQAVGLGGGISRQSINAKQRMMRKVRINGEWLVKIKPGKRSKKTPALYEINYDLLVPQSLSMPTFEAYPSKKLDEPVDEPVDDHLSLLRSDQKREEDPHTISNKVTTGMEGDENSENGGGVILSEGKKTEEELQQLDDELRYHRVRNPNRSEIAKKYTTRYIQRQILQLDKDFLKGIKFDNPGGALVTRIKTGHVTEDYPE